MRPIPYPVGALYSLAKPQLTDMLSTALNSVH
jgi:hypothetical protein